MNRFKLAVIAGGALFAAPALAQDAPDPMADPSTTDPAAENPADPMGMEAGTTGMEGTPPVDATAGIPAVGWPPSAIDRPYMRGKGSITAGGDFSLLSLSFSDPISGMSDTILVDFITLHGTYGITDQISAGAVYSLSLGLGDGDFEAAGPLSLWGGYQILHKSNLSIAATADFTVDLDNTDDMRIRAGLGAKYLLTPKMALFTGGPYGPVSGGLLVPGPVGNHLNISLADEGPITFDVPIGFGFQATPQLYAFATTQLASLSISNSDSAFIFADYIPLGLGALFSLDKNIDVTGNFTVFDLKEAGFDIFTFTVGARWYN